MSARDEEWNVAGHTVASAIEAATTSVVGWLQHRRWQCALLGEGGATLATAFGRPRRYHHLPWWHRLLEGHLGHGVANRSITITVHRDLYSSSCAASYSTFISIKDDDDENVDSDNLIDE